MARRYLPALALVVAVTASGCGMKTPAVAFTEDGEYLQRDIGDGLVASPNPLIPDVPMPVGFKAVASKSNWRFDGRVRIVNHVYQGHAKPGDAAEFYKRELKINNWALVDMQGAGQTTTMHYTKGPEKLDLSVTQNWGVATVKIEISAK